MWSIKHIKNGISIIILLIILSCVFSSCGDETVQPAEDFAPARFNWRTMEIPGKGFAGVWAMDTNKIFLLNHNTSSLYVVSGGSVSTYYVGNYYLNEIKGISNNEVYIFGTQVGGNMTIIKWNGAGFEYYPTDIYVNGFNVNWVRGCVVNLTEAWVLSQNGICKYDGVRTIDYSYNDSLLIPIDLFLTNDNRVQYIAEKWIDTSYIQQSLFNFQDTGFVRIYNYINYPYPSRSATFLREVGGQKFGLQLNEPLGNIWSICILYFTGSSFSSYFCFNKKINAEWRTISHNLVGSELQNFIYLVNTASGVFDSSRVGIIHWNGNKVSRELGLHAYENPNPFDAYILFSVSQNSFLTLEPNWENGDNTLYIGTRK